VFGESNNLEIMTELIKICDYDKINDNDKIPKLMVHISENININFLNGLIESLINNFLRTNYYISQIAMIYVYVENKNNPSNVLVYGSNPSFNNEKLKILEHKYKLKFMTYHFYFECNSANDVRMLGIYKTATLNETETIFVSDTDIMEQTAIEKRTEIENLLKDTVVTIDENDEIIIPTNDEEEEPSDEEEEPYNMYTLAFNDEEIVTEIDRSRLYEINEQLDEQELDEEIALEFDEPEGYTTNITSEIINNVYVEEE